MHLDSIRLDVSAKLDRKQRSALGQFMTPSGVAGFMAGLFPAFKNRPVSLLDAGAGIGSLTAAFLERRVHGDFGSGQLDVTTYEIDPVLRERLADTLSHYARALPLASHVLDRDFIEDAVNRLQFQEEQQGTDHGFKLKAPG